MRIRSVTLAGTIAVVGCMAVSAPALAADRPAPAPVPEARAAGLLDGLGGGAVGGLLGGLLGGSQQQPLQGLLDQLLGGQAPTVALLAPVQQLLDDLLGSSGLPPESQALIAQLRGLLASAGSGQPLPANVLLPVATLLRDLAGTQGVPPEAASLLTQIADLLDGDGTVPGLPGEIPTLPPTLIGQLDDVLRQLQNGGEPTGRLLAPVAALLDQVADADGLPPALSQLLDQLGATLASTTGALDPLLTGQLALALRTIAGTPGLSRDTRTTIERISTLLSSSTGQSGSGAGSGAGASGAAGRARRATARDRAVVKRVRVNRARTRIGVRIACPRSAPATCATVVRATLAGRRAARGKRVRIGAGRTKLVRLRMVRAAHAASVRSGGRLRVRVVTRFGAQRFADAKAVRVAPRR